MRNLTHFSISINGVGAQIHDLVSQIKVPVTLPSQPVSKTLLTTTTTNNGDAKRRKIDVVHRRGANPTISVVNNTQQQQQQQHHHQQPQHHKARRVITTSSAGTVATHLVVEDNPVSHFDLEPRLAIFILFVLICLATWTNDDSSSYS